MFEFCFFFPVFFVLPISCLDGSVSDAAWRIHYYQWAMQKFEQYNISEGACQFALAALEQVEEAYGSNDESHDRALLNESVSTIKGRLWAHVCKFTLDLNLYHDAYCAIISNPDEESKYIWLRRLIIVLYERGAIKVSHHIPSSLFVFQHLFFAFLSSLQIPQIDFKCSGDCSSWFLFPLELAIYFWQILI